MNLERERDLFLEWHYNTFLAENPNIDINNAKYIYDYSHTHEMVRNIRENNFAVWQASASRKGYKMVPVEPTEDMLNIYEKYSIAPIGKLSKRGYKAMIGAVE